MTPLDKKLKAELEEIARRGHWTEQRRRSMLGIFKSTQDRKALLENIRRREAERAEK